MDPIIGPRFRRAPHGHVHVRLFADEHRILLDLLEGWADQLRQVDPSGPLPPGIDRLFTPLFEEPVDDLDYGRSRVDYLALRALRLNRMGRCQAFLTGGGEMVGDLWRGQISLDEADALMVVTQDLRLTLARIQEAFGGQMGEAEILELTQLLDWLGLLLSELTDIFLRDD